MSSDSGPLTSPLAQFALGALALVVGAAVLFALVGLVSGDQGPVVDPDPVATGSAPGTPAPDSTTEPGDGATTPNGTDTSEPSGEATTEPPEPTETATEDQSRVDPSTVTIQVLDGDPDSNANHEAVLACLREAGYDSLITNPGRAYDTSVVFFTPGEGNEARAQQVAGEIGVASVEEKPENLSDSVPVHVMVGRDATDPC